MLENEEALETLAKLLVLRVIPGGRAHSGGHFFGSIRHAYCHSTIFTMRHGPEP